MSLYTSLLTVDIIGPISKSKMWLHNYIYLQPSSKESYLPRQIVYKVDTLYIK